MSSVDTTPSGCDIGPSFSTQIVRLTTWVQRTSALPLAAFALTHLTSPVLAAIAPPGAAESMASSFMLAGREIYQTTLTEPLLLYACLPLHVGAALVKRAALLYRSWTNAPRGVDSVLEQVSLRLDSHERLDLEEGVHKEQGAAKEYNDGEKEPVTRYIPSDHGAGESIVDYFRLPSLFQVAGWTAIPLLWNHVRLHRLQPFQLGISPSFMSYAFPTFLMSSQYNGRLSAVTAGVSYASLACFVLYHGLVGARKIMWPASPASLKQRSGSGWYYGYLGGFSVLLVGIIRLSTETVPTWMLSPFRSLQR